MQPPLLESSKQQGGTAGSLYLHAPPRERSLRAILWFAAAALPGDGNDSPGARSVRPRRPQSVRDATASLPETELTSSAAATNGFDYRRVFYRIQLPANDSRATVKDVVHEGLRRCWQRFQVPRSAIAVRSIAVDYNVLVSPSDAVTDVLRPGEVLCVTAEVDAVGAKAIDAALRECASGPLVLPPRVVAGGPAHLQNVGEGGMEQRARGAAASQQEPPSVFSNKLASLGQKRTRESESMTAAAVHQTDNNTATSRSRVGYDAEQTWLLSWDPSECAKVRRLLAKRRLDYERGRV